MRIHADCGAEVVTVVVQVGDAPSVSTGLWGSPVLVDRVLRGGAELVVHQCRDYVAWHQVEPDRRDVDSLDLPVGWQPRPPAPLLDQVPLLTAVRAAA